MGVVNLSDASFVSMTGRLYYYHTFGSQYLISAYFSYYYLFITYLYGTVLKDRINVVVYYRRINRKDSPMANRYKGFFTLIFDAYHLKETQITGFL